MPWNTTSGKSLNITDSAKYSKSRLSLSGDLEQETTKGLQLYNDTDYYLKTSNITIDSEHYITVTRDNINGTGSAFEELHTNINSLIKTNTEYTIVTEIKKISGNGLLRTNSTSNGKNESQFSIPSDLNFNSLTAGQVVKQKVTSISDFADISKGLRTNVRFTVGQSGSITFRLSILEGDKTSQAFEYEPFTGGKARPNENYPSMPKVATGGQKIKVAKNITMFPWLESDWENGTIDGVTGELVDSTTRIRMKEYKEVEANGKYLFDTVDNIKVVAIRFYDSDYNYIRMYGSGESSFLDSITVPSNAMYYKAVVKRKDDKAITTSYVKDNKLKMYKEEETTLDLGSTELCAIKENGNVVAQDRTIYHNAKWQFDKIIKKLILNGTENWQQTTAYEGFYRYSLEINDNDLIHTGSVSIHGINSHFQQRINQNHGGYEYLYIQGISRGGIIYIQTKNIDTVEKLKTFLAEQYSNNTPVTVYFVSVNHLYIDCTAEQSAVLDKLYNNFSLQKGTNNIIVESESGVGVDMELTYMQDNNLKHDKDIAELKQAIVALGGVI